MPRMSLALVLVGLSACTPVDVYAPDISFGPVETVRVGGRDYEVREAENDPVLRSALVSVGTDMGDSMVAGGMPYYGSFEFRDTIRVSGAEGRNVAVAVVAAYCDGKGGSLPQSVADMVVRIDETTGEYVFPFRCVTFEAR